MAFPAYSLEEGQTHKKATLQSRVRKILNSVPVSMPQQQYRWNNLPSRTSSRCHTWQDQIQPIKAKGVIRMGHQTEPRTPATAYWPVAFPAASGVANSDEDELCGQHHQHHLSVDILRPTNFSRKQICRGRRRITGRDGETFRTGPPAANTRKSDQMSCTAWLRFNLFAGLHSHSTSHYQNPGSHRLFTCNGVARPEARPAVDHHEVFMLPGQLLEVRTLSPAG